MDTALYSSALYVDMNIFNKNIQTLTQRHKRLIPVLKSDAYGLGLLPIARTLTGHSGVKMLAVTQVLEGATLREGGIDSHILVLVRENIRAFEEQHGPIEGSIRPDVNVKPTRK